MLQSILLLSTVHRLPISSTRSHGKEYSLSAVLPDPVHAFTLVFRGGTTFVGSWHRKAWLLENRLQTPSGRPILLVECLTLNADHHHPQQQKKKPKLEEQQTTLVNVKRLCWSIIRHFHTNHHYSSSTSSLADMPNTANHFKLESYFGQF